MIILDDRESVFGRAICVTSGGWCTDGRSERWEGGDAYEAGMVGDGLDFEGGAERFSKLALNMTPLGELATSYRTSKDHGERDFWSARQLGGSYSVMLPVAFVTADFGVIKVGTKSTASKPERVAISLD